MTDRSSGRSIGAAGYLFEPDLWDRLRLAWRLFRDPRVTSRLKTAIPALAALYLLFPIDPLPDFLLGVGQMDDLGVIGMALMVMTRLLPRLAPQDVLAEHLRAMGLAPAQTSGGRAEDIVRAEVVEAAYRVRD